MEQININQINGIIKNSNLDLINTFCAYTPPISSLKVKEIPKYVCSNDDIHYIRDKFLNLNRPIYADELNIVYNFMLGQNVPNDLKERLSDYLTEEMKEYIFREYLTKVLPNTNILTSFEDYDDDFNRIINQKFVPRRNRVPLRYYFNDERGFIARTDVEIDYGRILEAVDNHYTDLSTIETLCLKHLFKDVEFFNDKWLPKESLRKKNAINNQEWVDFENKMCEENDRLIVEKVKKSQRRTSNPINEEFSNLIINSIPSHFSKLEKAIYVYSKLCRLLSYDSIYYITEDTKSDILNVDKVDTYDESNNSIVCHHFAYILSDILRKIGIEDIEENISISLIQDEMQFSGHSNIRFLLDGNVIFADSTISVIGGDLTNHKFQNGLSGIRCELYDLSKQIEFLKAKTKVERYLEYEELENEINLPNIKEYDKLSQNDKYIYFNNCLIETNLYGIDLVSYAYKLIHLLDLNMTTKIMYKVSDLTDILLHIEINNYLEDGSASKISYLIDTKSKQVFNGFDDTIGFKESLTSSSMKGMK